MSAHGELTITRTYDAPRELVFECMTTAEHLTHFWGPVGVTTPLETIKVDLRPGGTFETVMVNDATGERYPTKAVYVLIDPPARLVWDEPEVGMTTTTTFDDLGDGRTEVVIHQANVPEMFRDAGARAGFESSLARFAAYVEALAGQPAS